MPLNPNFNSTRHVVSDLIWIKQSHPSSSSESALAEMLADHIMKAKCQNTQHVYQAWHSKKATGHSVSPEMKEYLEIIIRMCIGTPLSPKPLDHRQGWVAENLWYFLIRGSYPQDHVVRTFDLSVSSTDPGGDGLVIHRTSEGSFIFRLWEIKKVSGSSSPNATISRASGQLLDKGAEYLHRYILNSQNSSLPREERVFIDHLMDKWINKSNDSSVGVAIVCSENILGEPNFSSLNTNFPHCVSHTTLEGRTISLVNFETFCELVCEALWNGI